MSRHSIKDLIEFITVFTCIEPVLLRLCGPTRNGNLFCIPSYEAGDWVPTIRHINLAVQASIKHHWPSRRGKYAALNIDPLCAFGSVEVRCFPNTIDSALIYKWAEWLLRIRALAADYTDPTFLSFIDRVYNEPRWLLDAVFGNEALWAACHPQTPVDLVLYGVEQAYEIVRAAREILEWDENKPKAKKKRNWEVSLDDFPIADEPPDFGWLEE